MPAKCLRGEGSGFGRDPSMRAQGLLGRSYESATALCSKSAAVLEHDDVSLPRAVDPAYKHVFDVPGLAGTGHENEVGRALLHLGYALKELRHRVEEATSGNKSNVDRR